MITKITFPRELTESVGLREAGLHGLKSVVVLAGPNGAGKSRYLRLVGEIVNRLHSLAKRKRQLEQELEGQGPIKIWGTAKDLESRVPKSIWLSYALQGGYGNDPLEVAPSAVAQMVDANKKGGFENALRSVRAYFHEVARAFHEAENLRVREHPSVQMGLDDARAFNKFLHP